MIKPASKKNFYLLSGSPSAGKTTVLNALEQHGYTVVPEAARKVISQFEIKYGKSLLDTSKATYCKLLLDQCVLDYQNHVKHNDTVFFDCGLPDAAYAEQMIFGNITESTFRFISQQRYNQQVFFFPPWREIYQADNLRQTYDDALYYQNYQTLQQIYRDQDYQIIEVPKLEIHERMKFVIERVL